MMSDENWVMSDENWVMSDHFFKPNNKCLQIHT